MVDAGRPVLGVCLGAQQLAVVLGAEVTTGPADEVGLGQVELTAAGRRDPVTGPEYGGLGDNCDSLCALAPRHLLAAARSGPSGRHPALSPSGLPVGDRWSTACSSMSRWTGPWPRRGGPISRRACPLDGPRLAQVEAVGRRLLRRFVAAIGRRPPPAAAPPVEATGADRDAGHPGRTGGRRGAGGRRRAGQARACGASSTRWPSSSPWCRARPGLGRADRRAPRLALTIYAVSISLLFGVSALFHRHTWGPVGRRRMRRADHSTIFIAIAGSYTAVAGIALSGWARTAVLCIVWGGAVVGITLRQVWLDAPKWVIALPYVVVGWAAVVVLPQLLHVLGGVGLRAVAGRRTGLLGRCGRLRPQAPGSGTRGLRVPRGVPRLHHRRGRAALRGHRLVRAAPGR